MSACYKLAPRCAIRGYMVKIYTVIAVVYNDLWIMGKNVFE
jgi:hypothetical protein